MLKHNYLKKISNDLENIDAIIYSLKKQWISSNYLFSWMGNVIITRNKSKKWPGSKENGIYSKTWFTIHKTIEYVYIIKIIRNI